MFWPTVLILFCSSFSSSPRWCFSVTHWLVFSPVQRYLNNDKYVCWVGQISTVITVVVACILTESQWGEGCFVSFGGRGGREGRGGWAGEGQGRAPDSSRSILLFTISHLPSCLDLSEAEGSKAYSNGAFLPDTDQVVLANRWTRQPIPPHPRL